MRGDQFVAAAAGVKFPTQRAEFLDQSFFDKVMDVFGVGSQGVNPDRVRICTFGDFVEGSKRLLHFCGGKNANWL